MAKRTQQSGGSAAQEPRQGAPAVAWLAVRWTLPNAEIARRLDQTVERIKYVRSVLRTTRRKPGRPKRGRRPAVVNVKAWSAVDWGLPNAVIARGLNLSETRVRHARGVLAPSQAGGTQSHAAHGAEIAWLAVDWNLPDAEIARQLNQAEDRIAQVRRVLCSKKKRGRPKLGSPLPAVDVKAWSAVDWGLRNASIARQMNLSWARIEEARQLFGMARRRWQRWKPDPAEEAKTWGAVDWDRTDVAIARALNMSAETVSQMRHRLHEERPWGWWRRELPEVTKWLAVDWSLADAVIAKQLKLSEARVRAVRRAQGRKRERPQARVRHERGDRAAAGLRG